MTQARASILLRRLLVLKGSHAVYDQEFFKGVNIIRSSKNSTGKTTIMDFIFFVLGGDIKDWIEEASACDCVIAEVNFRGKSVTFRRDLDTRFSAISIYEGSFENAKKDPLNWLKFSHKRSGERESFSQVIFRLLDYPEYKLSTFSNITINEILRLIYCDQLTAVDQIFKQQEFDSDEMRQTVGEFLLGVDSLDIHGLRLELRECEKSHNHLVGRLKATCDILEAAGLLPNFDDILNKIQNLEKEQEDLKVQIVQLEKSGKPNLEEPTEVEVLRKELNKVKIEIQKKSEKIEAISFDLEDSKIFIESIKNRIGDLDKSEFTRAMLGEITFEYCPACLATIDAQQDPASKICHLCKTEHDEKKDSSGFLRMQYELNYQLRESEQLFDIRQVELSKNKQELENLVNKQKQLQNRYNYYITSPDPISGVIKDALTKVGRLEKERDNLLEKMKLVELVDNISKEKAVASQNIDRLKSQIELKEKQRENRWNDLKRRISELTVEILRNDIQCEESFAQAEAFEFDFGKNKMIVDGRSKFSASSICYLKSAFFFALFKLSLEENRVFYPRFSLLDNIEDKGSTPERVQNMHQQIISSIEGVKEDHQIIFTTSVLSPELKDSQYCVGPEYNFELKTLNLESAKTIIPQ
ncbi:MAG: AAA family ATPase [Candidatus Riflebacteria bacterium]|nr:AAA family ATPase [Candidatus Riflebacteria bacterium]